MRLHIRLMAFTFLGLLSSGAYAQWATLSGQFIYGQEGVEIPQPEKLVVGKDREVCRKVPLFDESLLVNRKNRGIANVFIWAYKPDRVHPKLGALPKKAVGVDSQNCRFEPHAITMRTGQTLMVRNRDPVAHATQISFIKNSPIGPIFPANAKMQIVPTSAEIIPVMIRCSIHPWMQGVVLIQDHPYMAKTDRDGKFQLKDLPAGELTLKLWHEKIGYVKTFTIDDKDKVETRRGRFVIELAPGEQEKHVYRVDPKLFAKSKR